MYIAIEGCIGSGKTTIAKLLASERKSILALEDYNANPFLDKFYHSPEMYSFETELNFALIHYHQIYHNIKQQKKEYITDFYILKDLLFAEMNLNSVDLVLFKKFYLSLVNRLPEPELIICLNCSDELIVERIKQRNQGSELYIGPEYFRKLNKQYEKFFAEMQTPKIEIDMNRTDFIKHPENITWLSNSIDELKLSLSSAHVKN